MLVQNWYGTSYLSLVSALINLWNIFFQKTNSKHLWTSSSRSKAELILAEGRSNLTAGHSKYVLLCLLIIEPSHVPLVRLARITRSGIARSCGTRGGNLTCLSLPPSKAGCPSREFLKTKGHPLVAGRLMRCLITEQYKTYGGCNSAQAHPSLPWRPYQYFWWYSWWWSGPLVETLRG